MRVRVANASSWLPYAVQGVFFAVWMSASSMISDHHSWSRTLISGVIIAPLFALVMWFVGRDRRRNDAALLDGLTADERRQVLDAARTGVSPSEPQLRAASVALAEQRLLDHTRQRSFAIGVFSILAALSLILVFTDGPWYLAGVAGFGWGVIWSARYAGQLRRRLVRLGPPDVTASSMPTPKSRA